MHPWQISVDTGGTFTDCIAVSPSGERIRQKVLSSGCLRGEITDQISDHTYAILENWAVSQDLFCGYTFNLVSEAFTSKVVAYDPSGKRIKIKALLPENLEFPLTFEITAHEEAPVLVSRLVTNTPLDRQFPPIAMRLGSTKGTNALLEGKGAKTVFVVNKGFKDILEIGTQQRPDIFARQIIKRKQLYSKVIEIEGRLDKNGHELTPVDLDSLKSKLGDLAQDGIQSAAIALMHSYKNPAHETAVRQLLLNTGIRHISVSSELAPRIKFLPRAETAVVNAGLDPVMASYLKNVREKIRHSQLLVMTSAGGLVPVSAFQPKDSLLSGPAGGVVGAANIAGQAGIGKIISFDMGGTSTDVARFDGRYDYRFEQQVGEAHLFAPALHIETVAAGGGSVCSFDGYQLKVGPESAGAFPGPACYGAGGPLTLTDVHLLLGRLDPSLFSIPVYPERARAQLADILEKAKLMRSSQTGETDLLEGFLQIANEVMAGAIRKISVSKGYDPGEYAIMAFGGAGGLQACNLAELLNVNTVLVCADSGLLSAYGIGRASIEEIAEKQILQALETSFAALAGWFDTLSGEALQKMEDQHPGIGKTYVKSLKVFLRFKGQDNPVEVEFQNRYDDLIKHFRSAYIKQFGHWPSGRDIEVESIRVMVSTLQDEILHDEIDPERYTPAPEKYIRSFFLKSWDETPVFQLNALTPGANIEGPAILLDPFSSTVIEPGWTATLLTGGMVKIERLTIEAKAADSRIASLELFSNRFMAIAEDMGAMLQRTAISVNVKERLDFSCALLDPDGELIANAPHIPVHLGSLGVCVRLLKACTDMQSGDVIVTNHPKYGGSHLPDITMVMPVFLNNCDLIGYVVNRAHHAEIGGTRPGSMPPDAKTLAEEGVIIEPFHLIRNGEDNWEELEGLLRKNPYPSRSVEENLADLHAALAANVYGTNALTEMAEQFGAETIRSQMTAIKNNAAAKIRSKIQSLPDGVYAATELLDDGTPLKVSILLAGEQCTIDFSGSGAVHSGNLNANEAIVNSVVIYVLRLLLDEDLPLNEGLLEPVEIILPKGILNPDFPDNHSKCPAVVGGNTETSQRLTDTLLKAFGFLACSQGTMNNVLFGNDRFGYYETIGGGGGAGHGFDGASAVHHHMTNTRITDPEILEYRYPVRLHEFSVRQNSGGRGKWNGGDGIVRKIEFLERVKLSVLTQHRTIGPYGIDGGQDGKPGQQFIIRKGGKIEKLGPIDQADMETGDTFVIETPGGGGWGK